VDLTNFFAGFQIVYLSLFFLLDIVFLCYSFLEIYAMDAGSLSASNAGRSRCPLQEQHLQKKHSRENVSVCS